MDIANYMILFGVLGIDLFAQLEEIRVLSTMGTADSPNYVNYVAVNYLNDFGNWLQSLNIIILTLKLFKYFRVSPKLNIMLLTISRAGSTMAYFVAILLVTTLGFAMSFYCAFNAELDDFSTIDRSVGTLLFGILGENVDFREISGANRVLAPVFHFLFTFVVSILFFSLFITMVDEAYNAVKEEQANKKVDIQSDILMQRLTIFSRRIRKKIKKIVLCLMPCLPALYRYVCIIAGEMDEEEEILKLEMEINNSKKKNSKRSNQSNKRGSIFGSFNLFGKSKEEGTRGKGLWVKSWQKQRKLESKKRALLIKHASHVQKKKHLMPRKHSTLASIVYEEEEKVEMDKRGSKYAVSTGDGGGGGVEIDMLNVDTFVDYTHSDSSEEEEDNARDNMMNGSTNKSAGADQLANHVKEIMDHFESIEKQRDEFVTKRFADIMDLLGKQQNQRKSKKNQNQTKPTITRPGRTKTTTASGTCTIAKSIAPSKPETDTDGDDELLNVHLEKLTNDVYSALEEHGDTDNFFQENKVEGSVLYFGNI